MRDPKRIDRILKLLEDKWKGVPDMRFGQLLINMDVSPDSGNFWSREDSETEEKIRTHDWKNQKPLKQMKWKSGNAIANKKLWDDLSKELQENVQESIEDALDEMYSTLLVAEKGDAALKEMTRTEFSIARGTLIEKGFLD